MDRRACLSVLCSALSVSIAGCSSSGNNTSGGGSSISGTKSPKEVTRSYLTAYFEGDYEKAISYTTGIKEQRIDKQSVAETAAGDVSLEEIISIEKSDTETEAAVSYVISRETPIGSDTITQSALLVKRNSEWLIARIKGDDGEATPDEASAYDGVDDGGPADVARSFLESSYEGDPESVDNISTEKARQKMPFGALESQNIETLVINSIDHSDSQATVQAKLYLTSPESGNETYDRYYDIVLENTDEEWQVVDCIVSLS